MFRTLATLLLLTLSALPSRAQSLAGLGAINGTVHDTSGAIVTGANITVRNAATGIQRRIATNDTGYFLVASLPPGPEYVVTVEKSGFATHESRDLQLQVGQNLGLNITLTVAAQSQSVVVVDATPTTDESKLGVSQVVEQTQIQN